MGDVVSFDGLIVVLLDYDGVVCREPLVDRPSYHLLAILSGILSQIKLVVSFTCRVVSMMRRTFISRRGTFISMRLIV